MEIDWTITILIIAIIIVLCMINANKNSDHDEKFAPNIDTDFNQYAPVDPNYYWNLPNIGWLSRRGLLPWWNSTRDTKNMSYDIRGDIPPIHHPVGPWNIAPSAYDHYYHPWRFRSY